MRNWAYVVIPLVVLGGFLWAMGQLRKTTSTDSGASETEVPDDSNPADLKDQDRQQADGQKEVRIDFSALPAKLEDRIRALIPILGAASVEDREKAMQMLLAINMPALPYLQEATRSPIPEISFRSKDLVRKILASQAIPESSFSVAVPANAILFVETIDALKLKESFKQTALSKFWALPETQRWWAQYQKEEYDEEEIRSIHQRADIASVIDSRAAIILGAPEIIDQKEVHPPFVFAAESKNAPPGHLAALARQYFTQLGDPVEARRDHPPFKIEEHMAVQTVFQEQLGFLSLMPAAMESFLNGLMTPPKDNLKPVAINSLQAFPGSHFVVHGSRTGLMKLVDAGHDIEEGMVQTLDALGFTEGSTIDGAVKVGAQGFEEKYTIRCSDPKGLLSLLGALTLAPEWKPDTAHAMDAIPPHVAGWISIRVNMADQAQSLVQALKKLDRITTLPIPNDRDTKLPQTRPEDPEKQRRWDALYVPRLERLEQLMGVPPVEILTQLQGGLEVGVLTKAIGAEDPDDIPMGLMVSAIFKDIGPLSRGLEAAVKMTNTFISREERDGGVLYYFNKDQLKPGCWIKGNRAVFSSELNVLALSVAALAHTNGNERFSDRADFKKALADKTLQADSRLLLFGDASQACEMPYKLAELQFNWDDENPWPKYDLVRGLLGLLHAQIGPGEKTGELKFNALTPMTFLGLLEAFRKPLSEAGFY